MFIFFFKQERCKDEKRQSKYACADQPSAPPGCRTDGAINHCMGSVSATSGPDTELQVPDEILQNFGMKTSFSKDVPKLTLSGALGSTLQYHVGACFFCGTVHLLMTTTKLRSDAFVQATGDFDGNLYISLSYCRGSCYGSGWCNKA